MRINLKLSTFIALLAIAIILLPAIALNGSNAGTACSASKNTAKDVCSSSCISNSSIVGVKFNDLDRNGIRGYGEGGVEGVVIKLYNGTTGALLATDVTDSSGYYAFTGLKAGVYEVREIISSGYVNTTPSIVLVTLKPCKTVTVDFGNYKRCPTVTPSPTVTPTCKPTYTITPTPPVGKANVNGVVFIDVNEDGTLDPNDPRVSGVTVSIASIYGLILDTDVTDSNGYYEFTGLSPASYRVFITVPDGFVNTTPTTVEITLTAGQTRQINFGLIYEEDEAALIKGLVFYDNDEDGHFDPEDSRISDVTVSLYSAGSSLLGTRTTNSQGYYEFADLAPGTYSVRVTVPSGYVATTDTNVQVTLSSGEVGQVPFGLIYTDNAPIGTGSIKGLVYYDQNGNGEFDADDQRVEGIGVMLRDAGGLVGGMQTNSQGFFKFEGLAAGTYYVSTELPDSSIAGSNRITVSLAAGETAGVSFAVIVE